MKRKKKLWGKIPGKIISLFLILIMVFSLSGVSAFAVTGSTVAADGVYTGISSTGQSVSVQVTVSNGKITGVTAPSVKSKYQTLITTYSSKLSGAKASYSAVDAVSAATSGKYGTGVKSAALNAIRNASAADGSDSGSGSSSGSGSGSGSGNSGSTQTEYTLNAGDTQTLSVDSGYNYYSWTSSDTSKVTVPSNNSASATITAITAGTSTVTCEYGVYAGSSLNEKKTFQITVEGEGTGSSDDSEIGQGVGSKTGTKYTGTATIDDEYITLDVYVNDGKISGIYIAAEEGNWLNLLNSLWDQFNGLTANSSTVDTVSSATTLGFRDTLRDAISNALSGKDSTSTDTSKTGQIVYTGTQTVSDTTYDQNVVVKSGADITFKNSRFNGNLDVENKAIARFFTVALSSPEYTQTGQAFDYSSYQYVKKTNQFLFGLNVSSNGYNATVGSVFDQSVALPSELTASTDFGTITANLQSVSAIDSDASDWCAITLNGNTVTMKGTPDASGDYPLTVIKMNYAFSYKPDNDSSTTQMETFTLTMPVYAIVYDAEYTPDPTNSTNNKLSVSKVWKDSEDHSKDSVTVGIYNGNIKVETLTLDAANDWKADTTSEIGTNTEYTVKEDMVMSDGEDVTALYEPTVTKGTIQTDTTGGWTQVSNPVDGGTYAITYSSGGNTYLLSYSGNSVIGVPVELVNNQPPAEVEDSCLWDVESSGSSILLSISEQDNYLNLGYSAGMRTYSAYASHEVIYTNGMIRGNGSYKNYLSANGASISAGSSGTSMTFWEGGGTVTTNTIPYTISNAVKAQTFTLKYDANGGAGAPEDSSQISPKEDVEFTLSDTEPTRDGYTFAGWADSADASTANISGTVTVTSKDADLTKTIYAVWTPLEYTISYDIAEGALDDGKSNPDKYTIESDDIELNNPSREGYTFAGWTGTDLDEASGTVKIAKGSTGDRKYTATWTANQYTVTFVDEDEETVLLEAKPYDYGTEVDQIEKPTTPTKVGDDEYSYVFDGWKKQVNRNLLARLFRAAAPVEKGLEPVTEDVIYIATYALEKNQYTVTFVDEDGTELSSAQYNYGTAAANIVQPENPTKDADENHTYAFVGWDPIIENVTKDATYTAKYDAVSIQVTVTFDSAGGTSVDAQTFGKDGMATTPTAPTKEGYIFAGWKLNGADYDFSTTVTNDITLVAQWTQDQTPETGYTVNTTVENHTYEIYQIFTGDYTEMTEGEGENQTKKDILTNIVWGENGTGTTGQKVDDATLQKLYDVVDKPLDDDKLKEIEAIVTLSNPIKTIEVNGSNPESVNLPAGYYLIKDKDGSQTGKADAYTTYITVVVKDYTVQPKSVLPTVDKQVFDDNSTDTTDTTESTNATNKNPGSGWYESADHAINQSFQFKLIATIPAPGENEYNRFDDYETYKLVFHDIMSEGVTFESIASVKVGSVEIPSKSDTSENGYEASTVIAGEGGAQAWSLTIPDLKAYNDMKNGATVTVVYNAHLNEKAIKHDASAASTDTNKNTVYLEYSNNPNTGHKDDLGKTSSDTVWVFTYKVENTKVDGKNQPLSGAGFRLYNGSTEVGLIYDSSVSSYRPVKSGETATEMTSAETSGKFDIVGLDAGTYTLKETTTPPGYNTCEDTTITIQAKHMENADTASAGLSLTADSNMKNTIVNNSGTILPSTGGMGTRLFYLFGTILVVGAGVVLVARRRMSA